MLGRRNRRGCEPRDVAMRGGLFWTFLVMWSTNDLATVLSVWTCGQKQRRNNAQGSRDVGSCAEAGDVGCAMAHVRPTSACLPPRATTHETTSPPHAA